MIQSNRIDGRFKTSFARHGRRLLPPPLGKMMPPAGLYGIIKHTCGCKGGVRVVPSTRQNISSLVRRVHRDEEDHLLPTTPPPQHPHTRTHKSHAPVPGVDGFKAALPSEIACRGLGMYVVQGGRKKGGVVAASSRRVVVSSAGGERTTNDGRALDSASVATAATITCGCVGGGVQGWRTSPIPYTFPHPCRRYGSEESKHRRQGN